MHSIDQNENYEDSKEPLVITNILQETDILSRDQFNGRDLNQNENPCLESSLKVYRHYNEAFKNTVLQTATKFGTLYSSERHFVPESTIRRWKNKLENGQDLSDKR